jgi:hypothetical protein
MADGWWRWIRERVVGMGMDGDGLWMADCWAQAGCGLQTPVSIGWQ